MIWINEKVGLVQVGEEPEFRNSLELVTDDVRLEHGDGGAAQAQFDEICGLYDEVFSAPPFRPKPDATEQHRRRLQDLIASPSFGISTATAGGELVGFAYGNRLSPTTRWWQGFLDPVPDDVTAEYEGRTFAVIDLAVREGWRRRGLGRRLLTTLLGRRTESRATLAVEPLSVGSQEFYRHLGWHRVGRLPGVAGESAPFYDIYLLPLDERT